MPPPRPWVGPAQWAAAGFTAVYALLAFVVFDPSSLLTLDAAIKWLQATSLVDSGYRTVALPGLGGSLDPGALFLPVGSPHVFWVGGSLHGIFPSSVALLNSLAVPFGLPAVAGLSVLGAGVVLLTVSWMADPSRRLGTVVVLATATPLWFYGVLPWEHVPALALSTSAAVLILNSGRGPLLAVAGVLMGASVTLRDESLILAPVLIGLAGHLRGWRRAGHVVAGCLLPLVLLMVADSVVFGRPAVAHLAHAVGPLGAVLSGESTIPRLSEWSPALRFQVAVVDWVFGLARHLWLVALGAIAAIAGSHRVSASRRSDAVLMLLVPFLVLLWHDLRTYSFQPDFVGGLLRLSPALVFAVLPVSVNGQSSVARRLAMVSTVVVLSGVVLTLNTDGGPQLGPRLLLPIVPLTALAAWEGLSSYRHSTALAGRLVWRLGVLAVAGSMVMQVLAARAYYDLNSGEGEPIRWLREATEHVLVTDSGFTFSVAVHGHQGRSIVMAEDPAAVVRLVALLRERDVPSFVFIARERKPDPEFPGFTLSGIQSTRLTRLLHWTTAAPSQQ